MNRLTVAALFIVICQSAFGANRVSLSGKVTDSAGKPIEHAMVLIYQAGVKKGYSTHCPNCYVDCGKRTFTDKAGAFTIAGLDSTLWFTLAIARDGYRAAFLNRVDPETGPAPSATLTLRSPIKDSGRIARGRIVDFYGVQVRDAVVEVHGIATREAGDTWKEEFGSWFHGIDSVAISSDKGEFEIA